MLSCKKPSDLSSQDGDLSDSSYSSSSVKSAAPSRARYHAVDSPRQPESNADVRPRQTALSQSTSYQCNRCTRSFSYLCDFHAHIRAHKKPGTCPHCCGTFTGRRRLAEHVRRDHPDVEFRCELCGASFRSSPALRLHRETHATGTSRTCGFCGERFPGRLMLTAHIKKSHVRYRCRHCDKVFRRRAELQLHSEIHRPDKVYKCRHCDRTFAVERNRLFHERRRHDATRRPQCETCRQTFASGSALKRHLETHAANRVTHKCKFCALLFGSVFTVRHHERVIHINRKACGKCGMVMARLGRHAKVCRAKPYHACSRCGKRFADRVMLLMHQRCRELGYSCAVLAHGSKCVCRTCRCACWKESLLLSHLRRVHGVETEKPYECHVCGKRFTSTVGHQEHVRLHGPERPFKCEQCDKTYCGKSRLLRHVQSAHARTVTVKPPNRCPICEETFVQQRSLTHHVRSVHPGQKPFKCRECDKSFVSIENVVQHARIHEVVRYECPQCDQVYNCKKSLTKHKKIHSGELFRCERCRFTSATIDSLNKHLQKHKADARTYSCPHCSKTYVSYTWWSDHVKTHADLPHKSDKCEEQFVSIGLLQRRKRAHGSGHSKVHSEM